MLICCIGSTHRPYGKRNKHIYCKYQRCFCVSIYRSCFRCPRFLYFFLYYPKTPPRRQCHTAKTRPFSIVSTNQRERRWSDVQKQKNSNIFLNEFLVEIEFLISLNLNNNIKYDRVLKQCKEYLEIILMGFKLLPLFANVSPFDSFTFIIYTQVHINKLECREKVHFFL